MFDDEFVSSLPEELLSAAQKIKAKFDTSDEAIIQKDHPDEAYFNAYLKAYGLLQAFATAKGLEIDFPDLADNKTDSIMIIRQAFIDLGREIEKLEQSRAKTFLESTRFHYGKKFGGVFAYEFSEGDLKNVRSLIEQLGRFTSGIDQLDKNYKSRLLKRLKNIQADLDKKVSDLDQFWALIGEAGVIKSKLGGDAQPVIDCTRRIAEIVWQTQARTEELPSGLKLPWLEKAIGVIET